jgi:hypothetical protein
MLHGTKRQKRILVIIIMAVLVSSVIAGAISFFNRSSRTATNNNKILTLNNTINYLVNFCMKFLPNGTSACDKKLGPVVNTLCSDVQSLGDEPCHDEKVAQYYKIRNYEIMEKSPLSRNDSNIKK